jgi:hypothetical protein
MNLFKYNLQFFAEGDEGAEGAEVAEPLETGTPETPETPEDEGTDDEGAEDLGDEGEEEGAADPQSPEDNARYAAARREAEAQMRQVQQAQAQVDQQFAQMFGKYKNPVTGQPIRNASEYIQAMQAQERMQMQEKLKSAGVDPEALDKAIANSPLVQNAQRMQMQFQQQQVQTMVAEDMRTIMQLDPSKTSEEDIINDPSYGQAIAYVQQHPGVRLSEAYKLVNFDRLMGNKSQAAQQAAVNQAKSKSHLKTVSGSAGDSKDAEIPASELSRWQQMFPDKTAKELKATYNRSLRAHGR